MKTRKYFAAILVVLAVGFMGCEQPSGGTGGDHNQTLTPTAADFTISGTGTFTYDGNPKTVIVTAKDGKTKGKITVKYEGKTTAPSAVGKYPVTFDVAAASGWNAATGLSAGTLTINAAIQGNRTPTAADYDIGNLTQTAGSVTAVTVTPKEGKSTGAVTIFYNGSTTLPTTVGTYAVTFNVAAVTNWNPATGLSAGNLDIGSPAYPTPVADDYIIGYLSQMFGSISAVTVTPKEDKSTGMVTVRYNNSTTVPSAVGTYTVTFEVAAVSGWNAASGLSAGTLTINPKVITFTINAISDQAYTGNEIKPSLTVKDGSTTLTLNTHYTVSYSNNTNAGTATVTVNGTGNYAGSTGSSTFTINNDPTNPYIITSSSSSFTATKSGATIGTENQPIQDVINAIRTHAVGKNPTIQFSNGTATLDLGMNSISFNNTGGTWGMVTLTGKITGSANAGTIVIANTVSITSTADIENTKNYTVYNDSTGTLTISGGTVSAISGVTVYNNSTGKITVSGTAKITSGSSSGTIYLTNSGTSTATRLEITGGTVENTMGYVAVYNDSTGAVTISGGMVSTTSGAAIRNNSTGTLTISGGTVSSTVFNYSTGAVNISGGTVSLTSGSAVNNYSTGKITVSGTAKITSGSSSGTIYLTNSGTSTATRLEITGGTVENLSYSAIYNDSTGAVTISGGMVSTRSGNAIYNNSTGKVTVSGGTVSGTSGITIRNNSTGAITISGGTVSATEGSTLSNYGTGTIIISGGTVSAISGAVNNYGTGTIAISGGTVSATSGFAVWDNNSTGKITVSGTAKVTSANTSIGTIILENNNGNSIVTQLEITGGTVENTASGNAVYNKSIGAVNISGGTVSGTSGSAIRNNSTGVITISGGTVSSTSGNAVYNYSTGKITVSGTAKLTSADTSSTINIANNGTSTATRLDITGGTVENSIGIAVLNYSTGAVTISGGMVSTTSGTAIRNNSTGTLTISGGTVSATTGTAIYSASTGKITVSGTAEITSANRDGNETSGITSGTINIANSGTSTATRLEITGGTVESTIGYAAVFNNSTGTIIISDGTVTGSQVAVLNNSTGTVTISGGTVSSRVGTAVSNDSTGAVNISGGTVSATTSIAVGNNSSGTITISGGTVSTTSGTAIRNNSTGTFTILGGTVSATTGTAIRNNSTGTFTISGGTVSATTGTAIYSASAGKITVSGTAKITSANTDGGSTGTIYLAGSETSTAVRLEITGGTVENTYSGYGVAVYNQSMGEVAISGGTVSAISGNAVRNYSTGTVTISGGTVSAISGIAIYNKSTGKITVSGTAKVTSANTDGSTGTIYILSIVTTTATRLEITGGTVENTSTTTGCAIYCAATDNSTAVNISGGTVTKSGTSTSGYAVYATNSGRVNITSGATISGQRYNC